MMISSLRSGKEFKIENYNGRISLWIGSSYVVGEIDEWRELSNQLNEILATIDLETYDSIKV